MNINLHCVFNDEGPHVGGVSSALALVLTQWHVRVGVGLLTSADPGPQHHQQCDQHDSVVRDTDGVSRPAA